MSPIRYRRQAIEPGGAVFHIWEPAAPEGSTATVLYLHGLGAYTGWHAGELAELTAQYGDYRWISPDLPGFGLTRPLPFDQYAPTAIADWVVRHLTQLTDAPVHVVGHSWGGELAVHIAARHPARVSSVALLDGGHVGWDPVTREQALASARSFDASFRFPSLAAFLAALRSRRRRWTPFLAAAYARGAILGDGQFRQRQAPETFAAIAFGGVRMPVPDYWPQLRGHPVLMALAADAADVAPGYPAGMIAAIPDLTWFVVPDCTHFMTDDAAPRLARPLTYWWRQARCAESQLAAWGMSKMALSTTGRSA